MESSFFMASMLKKSQLKRENIMPSHPTFTIQKLIFSGDSINFDFSHFSAPNGLSA